MENSAGAIFDNRGILVGNEAKNGVTESYENNYHYGWKPIELDKIKLEGGVMASDIGLPPEIHTIELPDTRWIAEQMVYYKNSLAIAKQNPEAWFENSLFLRNEVINFLTGSESSKGYVNRKFLDDTETGHQKEDKEDKYLNPEHQKERLLKLRQTYPQSSNLEDNDDFLLECVRLKYADMKQGKSIKDTPIVLSDDAKRSWLMPHGILTTDDWVSPIFRKGYLPAALHDSKRINAYDSSLDQDFAALQNLRDKIGEDEAPDLNNDTKIELPPNLTNGYKIVLPYLDGQNNVKKVTVIMFDNIDRIPPKIFRDNNDPENIPQKIIIMTKDTSGKLVAVRPDLDNTIVIKERMRVSPPSLTLKEFHELGTQFNPTAIQELV